MHDPGKLNSGNLCQVASSVCWQTISYTDAGVRPAEDVASLAFNKTQSCTDLWEE
jgi:hypothetical protein